MQIVHYNKRLHAEYKEECETYDRNEPLRPQKPRPVRIDCRTVGD